MSGRWVLQIGSRTHPTVPPLSPEKTLRRCRELVGLAPVSWAVGMGYANARRIAEQVPEMGGADGRMRTIRLGSEMAMLEVLIRLAGHSFNDSLPDEQLEVVHDLVHREVPLTRLLAGVRVGHACVAAAFLDQCQALADDVGGEMRYVSALVLQIFDRFVAQTEREYQAESERWFSTRDKTRQEAVNELLATATSDVADAEQRLAHPITGQAHLGLVGWTERSMVPPEQLEATLVTTLQRCGARRVLTIVRPSTVWAWGTSPAPAEVPADGDVVLPAGVRIAHGRWASGREGFRRTHAQALAAEFVASVCPSVQEPVVDHRRVGLLAVLLGDLERAHDFVLTELGDLARGDERTAELRRTTAAFLDARSPKVVAEQLFLARGTVAYRLRQAEELIGHPLSERTLELWAALLLVDHLPLSTRP